MFSSFSVKKPFTVVVAVIIIAILGVVSLTNMTTDLFPSINLPYAVVATTYIGASPEQVELTLTKPVEQSMSSISNIKKVSSISRENMSIVILQFAESANMDSIIIEMRENLDMIKTMLPEQVGSPLIMKINPDMMPVMVISASVKGQDIGESANLIEKKIIPEIESVEGIASVTTMGMLENSIHVVLKDEKINEINQKMTALQIPGVSINKEMVSNILKGQNFSMPTGYVTEEGVDYLVRTGENIKDVEELKKLTLMSLPIPGMKPIILEDVAEIVAMDNANEVYTKVNGENAVLLTIQKQTEYATSDVAKSVRAKIESIENKNEGVDISTITDQGKYIDIVVNSIGTNLIIGGILAILVLLLFLRDFKPTLVVGFAIPVSLVTAFVMMYFSNITLNIISMGGLALGVGMLVDNSIVVIENIYRMRGEGKSPKEAAIQGAKQVAGAITASTLTTIAVFAPILFTQGITREIFTDMGLTITYSLLASLMIALTLVPMVASKLMVKEVKKEHRVLEGIKLFYVRVLKFSLKHKLLVGVLILILFIGSIVGAVRTGTEFFPKSDAGQITVNVSMPKGSGFKDTEKVGDQLLKIIGDIEGVETVGATMSGNFFSFGRSSVVKDQLAFYVLLKDEREKSTGEIAQMIRDNTKDIQGDIKVNDSSMDFSAMSGAPISINIKGKDFDELKSIAKDLSNIVTSVEGTTEVSDGLEKTAPEYRITVDKDKSITYGLTVAQVFMEVSKRLAGVEASTKLEMGAKSFDIIVEEDAKKEALTRNTLGEIFIPTPQGSNVALKDIAEMKDTEGFSAINRDNQERYVTVGAQLKDGYNIGKVSKLVKDQVEKYQAPEGYTIEVSGQDKMIGDSFKDLFLMLGLAVVFIYLIMVAQFQSLLSPFIVMFTIPLAFTGGFMALIVTGKPLSIVAFVGLIVLSGVVVNNGIVFVDYVNILRRSGMHKTDAMIKAGYDRMRPIMMTALTTIFALLTTSFGAGRGTELMQPMAITTIGGLTYATLLTLIFIPILYDVFHRKDKILAKED